MSDHQQLAKQLAYVQGLCKAHGLSTIQEVEAFQKGMAYASNQESPRPTLLEPEKEVIERAKKLSFHQIVNYALDLHMEHAKEHGTDKTVVNIDFPHGGTSSIQHTGDTISIRIDFLIELLRATIQQLS